MTEGVDYAFPPLPSAQGLADAGKRFAGRYVGPGSGKFLTPPERDALFANGLSIFLLAEGSDDSASGGYNVGHQHAILARDHAKQLGAPDSTAIYFAVDYDVDQWGWPMARDYLRGACDVLGVGRVGVYGKRDVMAWAARDRAASWFFQTYAWSYGQWWSGNHVEQYLNGVQVAGGDVDLCRAKQSNFGQWAANATEDDMTPDQEGHLIAIDNRVREILLKGSATFDDVPGEGKGQTPWLPAMLKEIDEKLDKLSTGGVDVDALAAALVPALLANPDFTKALTDAAFQGAQRAEGE